MRLGLEFRSDDKRLSCQRGRYSVHCGLCNGVTLPVTFQRSVGLSHGSADGGAVTVGSIGHDCSISFLVPSPFCIISTSSCGLSDCSMGFRESCIFSVKGSKFRFKLFELLFLFLQEPFTTSCKTGISLAIFSVSASYFSINPGIFSKAFRKFILASCGSVAIFPLL